MPLFANIGFGRGLDRTLSRSVRPEGLIASCHHGGGDSDSSLERDFFASSTSRCFERPTLRAVLTLEEPLSTIALPLTSAVTLWAPPHRVSGSRLVAVAL